MQSSTAGSFMGAIVLPTLAHIKGVFIITPLITGATLASTSIIACIGGTFGFFVPLFWKWCLGDIHERKHIEEKLMRLFSLFKRERSLNKKIDKIQKHKK